MEPVAASSLSTAVGSHAASTPSVHTERRCNRRFQTDDLVILSPRLNGRVLDVSSTGMRVVTTTRLKPGEQLSFRLIGEHRSIASAIVRWCQRDSVFETRKGEILSLYQVGMALLHEPHRIPNEEPAS